MPRIESLSHVGVFTRNRERAAAFYTRKVGLVARRRGSGAGLLALGATASGDDAALALWQPDPRTWGGDYAAAVRHIGTVTGIGFTTTNLDGTVRRLRDRGVRAEVLGEEGGERYARFFDPDRNSLFLSEPSRPGARRTEISRMDFVTIVTRDMDRSVGFFTKALGLRVKRDLEEGFAELRLRPKGSALLPFTPRRESYEDPSNYEADMAHIGENTWIFFTTRDLMEAQDELLARGVRFRRKAEPADWGGLEAEFLDPDDNVYWLIEPRASRKRPR